MNKEQFFKAIDGVDDKLLKDVFDADEEVKLTEAETLHGTIYRTEHRPKSSRRRVFAAAAASLALVAGAGIAAKALTTADHGSSNGVVLSTDSLSGAADLIDFPIKKPTIDDLPESFKDHEFAVRIEHGFVREHFGLVSSRLKGRDYIRVPDGMFENYDFSNVGERLWDSPFHSAFEGDIFYLFPENDDFIVEFTDGKYTPFIDENVCEDYGVPRIDYSYENVYGTFEETQYIYDIVKALDWADTVEELEQMLAECDTDHRVDGFVIYKNKNDYLNGVKIEDPSGTFTVGMCIQVYWDNYSNHTDRKIANTGHRDFIYPEPEAEPSRDNCYPEDDSATESEPAE